MTCVHRWLIETPTAKCKSVDGFCRHCGTTRVFDAWGSEYLVRDYKEIHEAALTRIPDWEQARRRK